MPSPKTSTILLESPRSLSKLSTMAEKNHPSARNIDESQKCHPQTPQSHHIHKPEPTWHQKFQQTTLISTASRSPNKTKQNIQAPNRAKSLTRCYQKKMQMNTAPWRPSHSISTMAEKLTQSARNIDELQQTSSHTSQSHPHTWLNVTSTNSKDLDELHLIYTNKPTPQNKNPGPQ